MNVKGNTIQTSSDLTYAYSYHYAKLDAVAPSGFQPCWAPKYANKFQWIQVRNHNGWLKCLKGLQK